MSWKPAVPMGMPPSTRAIARRRSLRRRSSHRKGTFRQQKSQPVSNEIKSSSKSDSSKSDTSLEKVKNTSHKDKSSKSESKPSSHHTPSKGSDRDEVSASALPDPIPVDGPNAPGTSAAKASPTPFGTVTATAAVVNQPSATATSDPDAQDSAFLSWMSQYESSSSAAISPSATASSGTGISASATGSHATKHLPGYAIALIIVGIIGAFLALISLYDYERKKRRRFEKPTPSAPILQESPLFGGKERFSARAWPDPLMKRVSAMSNKAGIGMGPGKGWSTLSGGDYPAMREVDEKNLQLPDPAPVNPFLSPRSLASAYPTTPVLEEGEVVHFPMPADTVPVVVQPLKVVDKPHGILRRPPAPRAEEKPPERPKRDSAGYVIANSSQSPRTSSSDAGKHQSQKPYRPSKSRSSRSLSASAKPPVAPQDPEETFYPAVPIVKSRERRDRDTKALTTALGLASPSLGQGFSGFDPTSPISLYPDDSISNIHGITDRTPPLPEFRSPGGHAALGNLMLEDFPSTMTLVGPPNESTERTPKRSNLKKNDKPPRVPSPPTLPSLAQMAMENADPNYRSPTYSIYGLYEAQRKTKTFSTGGTY